MAGFEPAFSCFQGTRPLQAGPHSDVDIRTSRASVQATAAWRSQRGLIVCKLTPLGAAILEAVPAAGVEPAAFRSSGGRSYRLSYAGVGRKTG